MLTFFKFVIKLVYEQIFLKGADVVIEKNGQKCYYFTDIENAKFRKIILDVMSRACDADIETDDGIGTLSEKQMHAAIKKFICPDETKHEIKIQNSEHYVGSNETKNRKFVADVLDGNTIYEIQTGGFAPLKDKLAWILENTTYNIVLIHPMPENLYVSYIDEDGKISPRRKSNQSKKLKHIVGELYHIKSFINNPRFTLIALMIEADQYRKRNTQKKRARTKKYETIPSSLIRAHIFSCADDYKTFLPDSLEGEFTVKQFSKSSGILGIDAYSIVKLLSELGHIEECGNIGRAKAYRKRD